MSESKIRRKSKPYPFTLATATGSCTILPFTDMAGGMLRIGTTNTAAARIDLYVCENTTGPFVQLYDKDGSTVKVTLSASTAVSRAYQLPDEAFGAQYLMFVSGTTASTGVSGVVTFKG